MIDAAHLSVSRNNISGLANAASNTQPKKMHIDDIEIYFR